MSNTNRQNADYKHNYFKWLSSDALSSAEKNELETIRDDENEIKSRFSSYLSFGTAGLRGIMKTGMLAMNRHTVAYATQAMAELINNSNRSEDGVVIAYDSRNNSREFARTAASVLAANGVKVYIFDDVRPTPELSFALRHLKCVAGINITASHNPKEYNGYKAYWEDGAQLPPEHASTVSKVMSELDIFDDVKLADFDKAVDGKMITVIGKEIDEEYIGAVMAEAVKRDAVSNVAEDLRIVFTPLHGAGYKLIPEVLRRGGLKQLYVVPEQSKPDGDFPTVSKPNPEFFDVFTLGMEIAEEVGSDLVIAADPDADRVGVVARKKDGSFTTINGNQMGALLLDYIITAYELNDSMPKDPYAVKSIVSTELATKICRAHGVEMFNVLTGFKFIGEVIKNHEKSGKGSYIFGFEESYGYLKGSYARDKDAVVAAMLIVEMTAYYKTKNMTLYDALEKLWERYGYSYETNQQIEMTGFDSASRMTALMKGLRSEIPNTLGGKRVKLYGDYLKGIFIDTESGRKSSTGLPSSDVLYYALENGDVIVVRPSGTEPKVKIYYLISSTDKEKVTELLEAYQRDMSALTNV